MPEKSILVRIREYFGMNMTEFSREWRQLDDTSKEQIRKGIGDGTLTY